MEAFFAQSPVINNPFFLLSITIWSLAWKGLALWRAAGNKQKNWFIVLLVINSLGILSLVYLIWFAEKKRYWEKIVKTVKR